MSRSFRHLSRAIVDALEPRRLFDASTPFTKIVIEPASLNPPLEKTLIDVDGDGRLDAVVGFGSNGGIFWYRNPPTGTTWSRYTLIQNGDCSEDSMPIDMNGDGAVDLVCGFNVGVSWFENPRGRGLDPRTTTWTQHRIGEGNAHDIDMADLDGDGKIDVATRNGIYFQNTLDNWTSVLAGPNYPHDGDGVGLLDTGHGKIDLTGTGTVNSVRRPVWFENPRDHGGNPRTDPWIAHPFGTLYDPSFARGGLEYETFDMNHDGKLDIVTCQNEGNDFAPPPPVGVAWYEQPSDPINGTWTRHVIAADLGFVHRVRFADANGDGRQDIFYAEMDQSPLKRIGILYDVNGDGLTWTNQVISPGTGAVNLAVGDMDGDGDPDFIGSPHGAYGGPHPVEVYTNQRPVTQPDPQAPTITAGPTSKSVVAGTSVSFSVVATGSPSPSYQWQKDGANIPGATGATYTIASPRVRDGGAMYRVIVWNESGTVTSDEAKLVVKPAPPPPPPPPTAYLSDLNPTQSTNGWGPYERDKSNGEQLAGDGQALTINGAMYAKGLGVHAASDLRYSIAQQYSTFSAFVGVDAEVGAGGSVHFLVYGDATLLYDSGTMRGGQAAKQVTVSVTTVNVLRLVVADNGDGNANDHGDWGDAKVIKTAAPFSITRISSAATWSSDDDDDRETGIVR